MDTIGWLLTNIKDLGMVIPYLNLILSSLIGVIMLFKSISEVHDFFINRYPDIKFTNIPEDNVCKHSTHNIYIGSFTDPHKCAYAICHELGHEYITDTECMSRYEIEDACWRYADKILHKIGVTVMLSMVEYKNSQLKTYDTPEFRSHNTIVPYVVKSVNVPYTTEEIRKYCMEGRLALMLFCPYCNSNNLTLQQRIIDPSNINIVPCVCKVCHKVGNIIFGVYDNER